MMQLQLPGGVWSAAPTPFTHKMAIDIPAVERMVEHHFRLGVQGLFLAGTNGEGPWLPERDRWTLVRTVVQAVGGRMPVAVQVTDNSAARIIDNMVHAAECGATLAVIAPPYFLMNATPKHIIALYREATRACPLPVGIYDRGAEGPLVVPEAVLAEIYAEERVVLIKDSSACPTRRGIALTARQGRPALTLLTGDEFAGVGYLQAGYDGLLLGGGAFNGYLANRILHAARAGLWREAWCLQRRMNRLMYAVYGGKALTCWLAGEKKLLCELGIFSTWQNYLHYSLTPACERAIARALERDADVLLPPVDEVDAVAHRGGGGQLHARTLLDSAKFAPQGG
jgi:4-hydroxy-tetrahydrodipicolinate synthase